MTRIALVYFDAGGGHRNAATSLQQIIAQKQLPWQGELVNLQELLDPLDVVRRITGWRIQDVYNSMLRNCWTLGTPQLMQVMKMTVRAYHRPTARRLENYWRETKYDMVISFVPYFNRALCDSFARALPGRPFVTILTDFADVPPRFWIERQEQFVICGSDRAVRQAKDLGHSVGRLWQASGMILNPKFYGFEKVDRRVERQKLGLDPQCTTGLVLFGGQGHRRTMLEIDRLLGASGLPLQLIFICGKNERLAAELRARKSALPRCIEGFTTNVPYYMQLADFFIGKPGPGSIAEAMNMGLSVIVERNSWTLPQERYNADWVTENQVGLVVRNFSTVAEAVARLLEPGNFTRFRQNAAATENRALFEIPEILKEILGGQVHTEKADAFSIAAPLR